MDNGGPRGRPGQFLYLIDRAQNLSRASSSMRTRRRRWRRWTATCVEAGRRGGRLPRFPERGARVTPRGPLLGDTPAAALQTRAAAWESR